MANQPKRGNVFSAVSKLKLSQVAVETEDVLQQILEQSIPAFTQDAGSSTLYDINDVPAPNPRDCPRFGYPKGGPKSEREAGARVYVFNQVSYSLA